MFNLKYLLLLALISYTLQDSHCLVTVEYCEEEDDEEGKMIMEELTIVQKQEKEYVIIVKMVMQCLLIKKVAFLSKIVMNWKKVIKNARYVNIITIKILRATVLELYVSSIMIKMYAPSALMVITLKTMNVKKLLFLIASM